MHPVLSAPSRHGTPLSLAGVDDAWPGDEVEVDWDFAPVLDVAPGVQSALVVLVVLAHGMLAWLALQDRLVPHAPAEPVVITAQIVSEREQPAPASSRVDPAPVSEPLPAPAPAPAPVRPSETKAAPRPVPDPAAVLASPKAQAVPTQNAPPAPAEPKAAPPAPTPSPPAPTPAPQSAMLAPTPAPSPVGTANTPTPGAESPSPSAQPKELPMSAARYVVEPAKLYPRASRELGETGVVRLRVLVDEEGRPKNVQVVRSSGFPRLDKQALQNMSTARFQPYVEGGVPRAVWMQAEIVFNLD